MSEDSAPTQRPLWLVEGLDIVERRRRALLTVAAAISLVGLLLALLLPAVVPPNVVAGAIVGLVALSAGVAAAVGLDAADLTLRGPRHVRAAGAELLGIVPSRPDLDDARPLAAAVVDAHGGEGPLLLGIAAAGRDLEATRTWAAVLAEAVARAGQAVLLVDVAGGRTEEPGILEVIEGESRVGRVAQLDPELRLARVGAGRDLGRALRALPGLPGRLPRDIDVVVVSLPSPATGDVLETVGDLDHVILTAEADRNARVDLIAALDLLEGARASAQVLLVDDRTLARLAGSAPATPARDERADEPRREPGPDGQAADPEMPREPRPDGRDVSPPSPQEPAGQRPRVSEPAPERADDPATSQVTARDADVLGAAAAARAREHVDGRHQATPPSAVPPPAGPAPPSAGPRLEAASPAPSDEQRPDGVADLGRPAARPDQGTAPAPEELEGGEDPLAATARLASLAEELEAREDS